MSVCVYIYVWMVANLLQMLKSTFLKFFPIWKKNQEALKQCIFLKLHFYLILSHLNFWEVFWTTYVTTSSWFSHYFILNVLVFDRYFLTKFFIKYLKFWLMSKVSYFLLKLGRVVRKRKILFQKHFNKCNSSCP